MAEDEAEAVVSDGFCSSLERPKAKPPLDGLSVPDDPVPNTIPLVAPNLNPDPVAGGSDFFSSLEIVPNLNPPDAPSNLNPEEALVSFEVVSNEELPNLNPPDDEVDDSENEPPNLKPPDPDPEVLSDVPNLKPAELEEEEPNVEEPEVDEPQDAPKAREKQYMTKTLKTII